MVEQWSRPRSLSGSIPARPAVVLPIGTVATVAQGHRDRKVPADSNRTQRSVDIGKIDDNKVPDGKIVRNATIDEMIVDDGNRRDESPSSDQYSPDRSIEAGGERTRSNGAKSSPKDGRPSLTRCNSSPSRETVDVTRDVISDVNSDVTYDVMYAFISDAVYDAISAAIYVIESRSSNSSHNSLEVEAGTRSE
jgi:hypothetical protein